jgi:beta-glucosidase
VKNTGDRDGDEVPQVYFQSDANQAKQTLCAFTRVQIKKGTSTQVSLNIPAKRLRHWDTKQKQYVIDPGHHQLIIGDASDQANLKTTVTVK